MADMLDVVIGGGGFVGLSLGLALARGGLEVAVADPVPPPEAEAPQFDGRVSALSAASVRLLRALGVWDGLQASAQPIESILVTDAKLGEAPSPFSLYFDHRELGAPLGFIVENRILRQALFAAAGRTPHLTLIAPAAAVSLAPAANGITVALSNGTELTARLAVAADGRASPLRALMGIGVVRWAYKQTGIVATVQHRAPHKGTAYEHFLPSGPFAILPLTGNRSSLVWTEREDLAAQMMQLDHAAFDAEIARRFGAHLGATKAEGPRWSYPLHFHLARSYVQPRFALTGDAAHGIHPIAGQGLNLGLKDAAALSDVVLETVSLGLDPGGLVALQRYERWRRFDSFVMAAATDGLNRLFSNDIAPLRLLRDLGLGTVDRIGPLRRFFLRQAGGEAGTLPKLMQA
jgi:2-octaprenyl-6-methoxyphenol hydroxylase